MKFNFIKKKLANKEKELLDKKKIEKMSTNIDTSSDIPFLSSLQSSRPDLEIDYIQEVLMDSLDYYQKNPDVMRIGFNAVEHYFRFGINEKRSFCPSKRLIASKPSFKNNNVRKLYLSSAPTTDGSFKYRCLYQSERYDDALVYSGRAGIDKKVRALFEVDEVIFSRPEPNVTSTYLLVLAKNIGVKVTLDYDDLLLPDSSHFLGHVRSKFSPYSAAKKSSFLKTNYFYLADKIICSTNIIKENLKFLGIPIEVRKNTILPSMLSDKKENQLSSEGSKPLKIIYLSGTATHKKDYSIIHSSLVKISQKYGKKIELTFLGNVGVNIEVFKLYCKKVNIIPKVTFDEMLKIISEQDFGLVPLEDTIFNNAKSNIKFLECGSQGVPIIASKVKEFENIIVDKKNGWLCGSEDDWYTCLENIINAPEVCELVGEGAYETVKNETMAG